MIGKKTQINNFAIPIQTVREVLACVKQPEFMQALSGSGPTRNF
jgi:hypothetical protein